MVVAASLCRGASAVLLAGTATQRRGYIAPEFDSANGVKSAVRFQK